MFQVGQVVRLGRIISPDMLVVKVDVDPEASAPTKYHVVWFDRDNKLCDAVFTWDTLVSGELSDTRRY